VTTVVPPSEYFLK